MNQEWYLKLAEDAKYLEETLNLPNVCLVKRLQPTGEVLPEKILFNYWFGENSVNVKALPIINKVGNYSIQFKDTVIIKDTDVIGLLNKLSKINMITQKDCNGNVTSITFSTGKKKGKKKKCSDTDVI